MHALDVDDGEATDAERCPIPRVRAPIVGTPMRHHVRHPIEGGEVGDRAGTTRELDDPAYPAHADLTLLAPRQGVTRTLV